MARLTALATYLAAHPEFDNLPDWQVADTLNQPDQALGLVRQDIPTDLVAAYLDRINKASAIEDLADSTDPATKGLGKACLRIINGRYTKVGVTDPANAAAWEAQLAGLVGTGLLLQADADGIDALGWREQSWAESAGYGTINSRDVSQARAGNLDYGE